ncbi:MAG: UDP-N-acetylmuramoyl-L-alanyl-D-glutamate--2,6-diaminopimelate ligase [Betaproteobacteria bacterium ADurb.Bin341]|nr:MAG: UDP-N-acetylmuramoyl-L-alanyl-D-glutamate--2,6-diaminopimelate ligase [Betaproteobacteria bacterium ADurb.Bin341]
MSELIQALLARFAEQGVRPAGVAEDSRQVCPGDLFVAYAGDRADGRSYIADALERGAVAVLWQPGDDFAWDPAWTVPNQSMDNLRPMVGPLAHAVAGYPAEVLSLIAVTGTNGKTSVSQWIARSHPKRCAVVGTLGAGFPDTLADTGFTTPEAACLARLLTGFCQQEAQVCALEASSIGIEEGRLNGAHVDTAVFTNFTRDHLDYHGSMDAYAAAKRKLFAWPRLRLAVLNLDDALGRQLARETTALKVLGYCIGDGHQEVLPAILRAENLVATPNGQTFALATPRGKVEVETRLLGRFNVSNLLAVAAILVDAGLPLPEIAERLAALTPPPERVGGEGEPLVVVDYAHSPDALENALVTLREVAEARKGKLVAVFGCGGDRDRGKRPIMGELASRCADRVVLTSDNPRTEQPEAILQEIAVGVPAAEVIVDRAAAIRQTILTAEMADVLLLAGKGHEPYQEIMGVRSHFSDLEQAEAALLARRRGQQGAMGMRWMLADIVHAVGGRLIGENIEVQGVSTDTRRIAAGQLFVALRGEQFDAHDFLADAQRGGAVALMLSTPEKAPAGVPVVLVDDTRLALGRMAAVWRRSFDIPVLAVTGSNGKTTTKEMIASILKGVYGDAVLATQGNLNNDIGLPLTLLGLTPQHRVAVIEMGMNHPGEIAYLTALGAPTVAVVNNAQRAHLEGMGDLDEVAREKGTSIVA